MILFYRKTVAVGVSALQTSLCAPPLPVGACELKFVPGLLGGADSDKALILRHAELEIYDAISSLLHVVSHLGDATRVSLPYLKVVQAVNQKGGMRLSPPLAKNQ